MQALSRGQRSYGALIFGVGLCLLGVLCLTPAAYAANVTTRIIVNHSNQCLTVRDGAMGNGVPAIQASCTGAPEQLFELEPVTGYVNLFRVIAQHSRRCLHVQAAGTADGTEVVQSSCVSGDPQRFQIDKTGPDAYRITAAHSAKVLETADASTASGAQIEQANDSRQAHQRWRFSSTNVPVAFATHEVGRWGEVIEWPEIAISAGAMPNGKVLTWSSTEINAFPSNREFTHASVFDPMTGQFESIDNPAHDMFCAGVSMLEDGNLIAAGGNPSDRRTSVYDWKTGEWRSRALMNRSRWYGSHLTLPGGHTWISHAKDAGNTAERYDPDKNIWTLTTGTSMQTLVDEQNANNARPRANTGHNVEWWAHTAVAPSGEVFQAGPMPTWHLFNANGVGSTQSLGQPAGDRGRMYGNIATYGKGKVLLVGGYDRTQGSATDINDVYRVDLNGAAPVVTQGQPTTMPRSNADAVTLPTGEVLIIGGNVLGRIFTDDGSVYTGEIWNPDTNQWRMTAGMSKPRNYHSTTLLLQDGRVLAAGGGGCGSCNANHRDGQIFSPPYLFKTDGTLADRPVITSAPLETAAAQTISVQTSVPVERFSLVRLSAVTHAMNTDQRHLRVEIASGGNGDYQLNIEANPNVLIPGYYWLFAIDANGHPSVGHTIQVRRIDADGDGVIDLDDEFPNDPNESTDTDGDGVGDNTDAFPTDANEQLDSDGDGLGDNSDPQPTDPGLPADISFEYFHGTWSALPDFDELTPVKSGRLNQFGLTPRTRNDQFGFRFTGRLNIDIAGEYTFFTASDDGSQLFINGELIVDNDGLHGVVTESGRVELAAGTHDIVVTYFERGGGERLTVSYAGPVGPRQSIPIKALNDTTLPDADADGVPDRNDAFPDDPDESSDRDGDGVGDNADVFPDDADRSALSAPAPVLNSTSILVMGQGNTETVWTVNPDNNSVSIIDSTGSLVREISVGDQPQSLAQLDSNRIVVVNKASASLSEIDIAGLSVVRELSLPPNTRPHGIVVSSAGGGLFVALEATHDVIKVSPANGAILGVTRLTGTPRHLAISPDGQMLYAPLFITPHQTGESTNTMPTAGQQARVERVETTGMNLLDPIALGYQSVAAGEQSGPGLPNYLHAPVISTDGLRAYLPSKQDNIAGGLARTGQALSFDHRVRAVTSRLDLRTNTENPAIRIDHDNASLASAAVLTEDGRTLFIALETSREVVVYDLVLGFSVTRIPVGRAPQGLALSANGAILFVQNFMDRTVSRLDITDVLTGNSIVATPLGTTQTIVADLLPPQVLRGKQLFYDAADNRLARDNYVSCASCHSDGGHDGRSWDLSQIGEGVRNTIDLRGKAGTGHGRLHWSANFDEVHDFEQDIRVLFGGTGLMSDVDFSRTSDALGQSKAGLSADLDAMATYVTSLSSVGRSPWRDASGTLTAAAADGRDVFQSLGCQTCHSGQTFTDSPQGRLHDIGTVDSATGQRAGLALSGLDTPTLRGVWATAPYLHDGSASTLDEAVLAHRAPGLPFDSNEVSAQDMRQLVSYLKQIDDDETAAPELDSDGDGLPDSTDPDDDNDGVNDGSDAFPNDPLESVDTDNDGIGNNADPDDDNDGVADAVDADPLDPAIGMSGGGLSCNRLLDGNFESGLGQWQSNASPALINQAYAGNAALRFEAGYLSQLIAATPQAQYRLSGFYRSFGNAGWAGVGIDFIDTNGQEIGETVRTLAAVDAYTAFDIPAQVPANTSSMRIWFFAETGRSIELDDLDLRLVDCVDEGGANGTPIIQNPGNQSGQVGDSVSLAITGIDPDGDNLSYSAVNLPAGLSIDPASGLISGQFTQAGSRDVTVTVNDGRSAGSGMFTWSVLRADAGASCNLLSNGDFELGAQGWASSVVPVLVANVLGTDTSLQFSGGWISSTVQIEPLAQYVLSGDYLSATGNGWSGVGVDFLDADGIELGEQVRSLEPTQSAGRLTLNLNPPAQTASARVWFYTDTDRLLTLDALDFRNVQCPGGPTESPECNLVLNSGFETGDAGWSSSTSPSLVGNAPEGQQAYAVTDGWVSYELAVEPGLNYLSSAQVSSVGNSGWSGVGINFIDANGAKLSDEIQTIERLDVYSLVTVSGLAPIGSVTAQLWFYADAGRTLRIDQVSMAKEGCTP
ncbi:MAG: RICIN domain-containing protein [Burkholderiaceae bacterium]